MKIEKLVLGVFQTNCYIVSDDRKALIIDPADQAESIVEILRNNRLETLGIIATHGHFDHVLGVEELQRETGAPFYLHGDDQPLLLELQRQAEDLFGVRLGPPPKVDHILSEGDRLIFGQEVLSVIHTPGHTPGGISLFDGEKILFCGDALFAGSIGRADLPGGSFETLIHSIQDKLLILGSEVVVYPGHGPTTTIGREKASNPFLQMGA